MDNEFEFFERLNGICESCLGTDCGDNGAVRLKNSPFEVGRKCVEAMFAALPKPQLVKQPGAKPAAAPRAPRAPRTPRARKAVAA